MAVVKDLNPALVRDGGDEVEAVTVDINVPQCSQTTSNINMRGQCSILGAYDNQSRKQYAGKMPEDRAPHNLPR